MTKDMGGLRRDNGVAHSLFRERSPCCGDHRSCRNRFRRGRIAPHRGNPCAIVAKAIPNRHAITDERRARSEEHTSELQSLMRISYAVFCVKEKPTINIAQHVQTL